MKTNFDFLLDNPNYTSFAKQAVEAERSLIVSPATCAILSRRALELAVRFVYSFDGALKLPYRDNVSSLIHEDTFRDIIDSRLFPMLKYVIHLGNVAVHTNSNIKRDDATVSLRDLFEFCDWIDYTYSTEYEIHTFDESLLGTDSEKSESSVKRPQAKELQELYEKLSSKDKKLEQILKENEELRKQMVQQKEIISKSREFEFDVDRISEDETRKRYIDVRLQEVGWVRDVNCTHELELTFPPNEVNPSGTGRADYVLWGADKKPLAVVEAKRASKDPIIGTQQAKLYADSLERQYNQRPLIFVTNGFEFFYTNDSMGYPMREVSGFFTQDELQLEVDRRESRKPLVNLEIKDKITDRPYQKEAITAVCEAISNKRRKMLIVQATGSGKTRVSISLVELLTRHNYVKNILFLADRTELVSQAKKNYNKLLKDLTCCNLLENKADEDPESSRMIFSTYPTMMNAIDEAKSKDGKLLFTPAHFDLIITDEAHRSIYKKYQEIFDYFDAIVLGMTATPKSEVGRNTYKFFELEDEVPTYAYELKQAVDEGYLVDYVVRPYHSKIMEEGIHYKELSVEEKEQFDETFEIDDTIDEDISNSAINNWLFNADTIDKVLINLMEQGYKVEGGDKLGKTIIFAKNSRHAKAIVDRFNILFPEYGNDYIKQIDYSINYVKTLIADFSAKDKEPRIAVSVDMLDTGIDIPEILNLVFFKKVRSSAKFWQMIGRGTRLCPDLLGVGLDKKGFLVFDYCNNFEYFEVNHEEDKSGLQESPSEKLFVVKTQICRELQAPMYTSEANEESEGYIAYRKALVSDLNTLVIELNNSSFTVKRHLRYVEKYRDLASWGNLEVKEIAEIKEHIAPLAKPKKSEQGADAELKRKFDYLIYSIDLGLLQSKNVKKPISTVIKTAEILSTKYTIDAVKAQKSIIEKVLQTEFWDNVNILELEKVREALRDLLNYIEHNSRNIYYTDFEDTIVEYQTDGMKADEKIYSSNDLQNYRKKVEFYLEEHKDRIAVYKLRNNKKLTQDDMKELERILWEELGTKSDYEQEYGDTPIGTLVRKIVGVSSEAVNEAFAEFLQEDGAGAGLNFNQMQFVRLIMDYIVANGNIEDRRELTNEPFKSVGSITSIFKNRMDVAAKILDVIDNIKQNSEVTA